MRGEVFGDQEGGVMVLEKWISAATAVVEATPCAVTSEPDETETGEPKKTTKVVRKRLTKEEIERMLSIPEHRKPFPMVAESFLARIHDPAERARYMGWADVYYKSREQQYVREELETLGYVEREVEVTDDEDDAGDN